MKFRCCDCGEDFDAQSLLEQHISIEHLSWSPYWCLYCKQNGVTLKKATKDALKTHVEKIHVGEQFLFIYEPDDAKEQEHRDKLNRSLALETQDDTAHYPLLSPAPTPVSPLASSALEPKLEPFEQSELPLPDNSNDMSSQSQFSSPLSHCLTCGAQIFNDGHKHKCQFPPMDKPADPTNNKLEVSYQLGELFTPDSLINKKPTSTPRSKAKKKFACTVCGKECDRPLSLRIHEDGRMHWGLLKHLTRLECDLCPAKYHFARALRLHRERVHNAEPNTAQDNTAHHSLHSPAPTPVSLTTSSALEPKLEPFEQSEFQLPDNSSNMGCSRQFWSPNHCLTCGAQILNDGHLKHKCQFPSMDVLPVEKAKKKFACTVCGKEYTSPLSLRMHEDSRMHWGLLKHLTHLKCDLCPAKYHFAKALQLHRKKLHNAEPKTVQDAHVNRSMAKYYSGHYHEVLPHNRSSNRLSSWSSNYVPDNSTDTGWLFSYPLSHCQEPIGTPSSKARNTFTCTVCGKEYGTRLALRKHEDSKMHWGLLKHLTHLKCDLCPSKYHFVNALRLHKNRVHNAEQNTVQDDSAQHSLLSPAPTLVSMLSTSSALEPKLEPFEESEFQLPANSSDAGWRQFSSSLSDCEEPIRTPMSKAKKTFACTVCGKEYGRSESLRKHEDAKMHWGLLKHLTRLQCDLCPAKYHFAKALRLHKKRLHNAEPNRVQDDTAHHSLLSPAATLVSPSTSSALEPKHEPFDESEFQLPDDSSDMGWQISSPLSHCLTCGAQILNDGHKHECQFCQEHNLTNEPTPTVMIEAKKKLPCTVCGKEFSTPLSLRLHEDSQMHWGLLNHLARFKCDLCPAKFHYTKALQLHRRTLHNAAPNIYSCWCRKKYALKSQLLFHQDHGQHHQNSAQAGLKKCPLCSYVFYFTALLKGHMRSSHHKRKIGRPKEPKSKPSTVSSKVVSVHHHPFLTKCKLCSQRIRNNRASKSEHAKLHFSGKPIFKCSMCPKEFEKLHALRYHEDVKMHWGTLKHLAEYHCKTCNRTFHYRNSRNMHKEMIDYDERKEEKPALSTLPMAAKVQCQLCDRVFRHEAGLTQHLCHGKPSYTCEVCEQDFDNLEALDLHRKNSDHHEIEKPVVECPSCNKSFRNKKSLIVHKTRVHSEKKAKLKSGSIVDCAGCGKVCKSLKVHKHQCPNLKQGVAQATIYSCSMCPRRCNSIVTMRLHQRAHRNKADSSMEVMSTCVPCSKHLAPSEIDSHLLKVHLKKVNNQVILIQEDGNEWDQTNIFDGDLMGKMREKLIIQDHIDKPKLKLEAFKCKHCGKLFTTKEKLKKHQEMLVKSKLMSAKVDFTKSEKHLMAKICVKKYVKVIRKCSNVDAKL